MAYESLAAQVAVLGQGDLQLLGQALHDAHIDVCTVVVGGNRRHVLEVTGAHDSRVELAVVLAAEKLGLAGLGVLLLRLLGRHEVGLVLLQEGLDRELIDQSDALVHRVLLVYLFLLD